MRLSHINSMIFEKRLMKESNYSSPFSCYMQTNFVAVRYKIWRPSYWPTGRLADNQKMRNLTDNLSKGSNETYSEV